MQFVGQPYTTVVGLGQINVAKFFGLYQWPLNVRPFEAARVAVLTDPVCVDAGGCVRFGPAPADHRPHSGPRGPWRPDNARLNCFLNVHLPVPDVQEDAIAIYDCNTNLLLTGERSHRVSELAHLSIQK